jgi:hypothetical protein
MVYHLNLMQKLLVSESTSRAALDFLAFSIQIEGAILLPVLDIVLREAILSLFIFNRLYWSGSVIHVGCVALCVRPRDILWSIPSKSPPICRTTSSWAYDST